MRVIVLSESKVCGVDQGNQRRTLRRIRDADPGSRIFHHLFLQVLVILRFLYRASHNRNDELSMVPPPPPPVLSVKAVTLLLEVGETIS